ncbi:Pycsar system effector family protein [Saccharopolyspora gregorii]|uniref:Pycsar system effector family protein n=1 Tax=Saccharopolyspora gregorii TaxID=33914 RepID=UPI0021AC32C7|nr:Pycsar system effector family protein [Saccharopolyspora gregorii]
MKTEYIAATADRTKIAARVTDAKTSVSAELQRGDAKASYLLGLFGAVLAGVVALMRSEVSTAAMVLLTMAAIPTAAAVVLLLWVLRPNLNGQGCRSGFLRWAAFLQDPAALANDFDRPRRANDEAHHLAVLSVLAITKYQRIAIAIYCLLTGLTLTALALIAA